MIIIRNTNEKYGAPETFTGETLADAVAIMQAMIRDCGPEFVGVVVTEGDYEVVLTDSDKRDLGRLCTRDSVGRHFTESYALNWLDRMEAAGFITIHRPVHDQTGIPYSAEYWSTEVSPEVVEWFDDYGELIEAG